MIIVTTAEVAQVVEHGTENAGVDSSSLSLGTITILPLNSVAKCLSAQPAILLFADIFRRRRITTVEPQILVKFTSSVGGLAVRIGLTENPSPD